MSELTAMTQAHTLVPSIQYLSSHSLLVLQMNFEELWQF